jgi:uncharacterized RDD family membrane protein YckC
MPRAVCPRCKAEFTLKPKRFRSKVKCPKCKKMFNPSDEPEPDAVEPDTEAPEDPPTETGPTVLKCNVCGETAESEEGALSMRCPLCGGVMRSEAPEAPEEEEGEGLEEVAKEEGGPKPETETAEAVKVEPKPKPKPKRRRKFKRRKRRSRLSTRQAGRLGGLRGKKGSLGEPIPTEYRVGFGRRLLALFLDGLIIGAVGAVMGVLLVTFYLKELNEIFSYPADLKKVAEIDAGILSDIDSALDDGGSLEEEEEETVAEESEESESLGEAIPEEGAEEQEVPPELQKPRLLFDGRLGQLIAVVLSILFVLPFFGIVELSTSASIGKKILAMSVRNDDGRPARGNSLFGRYMIKYGIGIATFLAVLATTAVARAVGDILLVIGALDALFFIVSSFVALSASRQALHDQLLFTAVYPDILPQQSEE